MVNTKLNQITFLIVTMAKKNRTQNSPNPKIKKHHTSKTIFNQIRKLILGREAGDLYIEMDHKLAATGHTSVPYTCRERRLYTTQVCVRRFTPNNCEKRFCRFFAILTYIMNMMKRNILFFIF